MENFSWILTMYKDSLVGTNKDRIYLFKMDQIIEVEWVKFQLFWFLANKQLI
jgi:hypothetical protein